MPEQAAFAQVVKSRMQKYMNQLYNMAWLSQKSPGKLAVRDGKIGAGIVRQLICGKLTTQHREADLPCLRLSNTAIGCRCQEVGDTLCTWCWSWICGWRHVFRKRRVPIIPRTSANSRLCGYLDGQGGVHHAEHCAGSHSAGNSAPE